MKKNFGPFCYPWLELWCRPSDPKKASRFEYVSVMHEMSTAFYGVRLNINRRTYP